MSINQLIIHSGKRCDIIVNNNSVLNRRIANVGINLLCFDKTMTKSLLWNFNHTQVNMTKKFTHIINVLPKHLYCVIIIQGNILRCMNAFVKKLLINKLKCKKLDNLRRFSAWSLVFYRDDKEYVNVRETHEVNNKTSMYLSIYSNPIIAREEALREYEEKSKFIENKIDETTNTDGSNNEPSKNDTDNVTSSTINYQNELDKYSEKEELDKQINDLENLQKQIENIHMNVEKISDEFKKSIDNQPVEESVETKVEEDVTEEQLVKEEVEAEAEAEVEVEEDANEEQLVEEAEVDAEVEADMEEDVTEEQLVEKEEEAEAEAEVEEDVTEEQLVEEEVEAEVEVEEDVTEEQQVKEEEVEAEVEKVDE